MNDDLKALFESLALAKSQAKSLGIFVDDRDLLDMWTRDVLNGETKEKKTPAMLIGLAKGIVSYEDVIYFKA